jgi:uncharacterized protein (TIGR02611 family)
MPEADGFGERLVDAAIEAELETGEREPTREAAKANVLIRLARMTVGCILVLVGVIAIPLPGPGWLIVCIGLGVLSRDVAWADRLLRRLRQRIPGAEDPKPWTVALTVAFALGTSGVAIWLSLTR